MNLFVDHGNSRVKWVWQRPSADLGPAAIQSAEDPASAVAGMTSGSCTPDTIVMASTGAASQSDELHARLTQVWTESRFLVPQTGSRFDDLINSYGEPSRMGVDRWLAMIGARAEWKGRMLVVDAGTAVTCDMVNADGSHQGGWIFPGRNLMQRALGASTAQVGFHVGEERTPGWGTDTAGCVAAGTLHAVTAGIRCAGHVCAEEGPFEALICGGDEALAFEALRPWAPQVRRRPMLVFTGMAIWLASQDEFA